MCLKINKSAVFRVIPGTAMLITKNKVAHNGKSASKEGLFYRNY